MNPPVIPGDVTAVLAIGPIVYGKNLDFPTEDDELEHWRVDSVTNGLGTIPTCTLTRDSGIDAANVRLKDIRLDGQANYHIEVWLPNVDGERETLFFVGEIVAQPFSIAKNAEYERAVATIPPYWFGDFCLGQVVMRRTPLNNNFVDEQVYDEEIVHHDLEFNPMVDGVIVPNMNTVPAHEDGAWPYPVFIDPESTRTETARNVHGLSGEPAQSWTLRDAVYTLTRWLNADEEFVLNPVLPDDWGADAPPLKNVILPRGRYLSEYLSMLLPPFGYDWTLDFIVDEADSGKAKPVIRLVRRGEGTEKQLYLDEIGDKIDLSNMESAEFEYNVANLRNKIIAHGSLVENEFSFLLYRSWPTEDDDTWSTDDPLNPIGRKFVANTAGDYSGVRDEIDEVCDLSDLQDLYIPKRHRPEDRLRWQDELHAFRQHAVLEWSLDDGDTWEVVQANWHPLQDEVGVWFSNPPTSFLDQPADHPLLRLTCVLPSDERVSAVYDDTATSVNGRTVQALLDVEQRFHQRQRRTSGDFRSRPNGEDGLALPFSEYDLVDDSEAGDPDAPLQVYVDRIGEIMRAATVGISPVLPGINMQYMIGDVITGIAGRNISLNCLGSDAGETRFPQITGFTWLFNGDQKTMPTLTPYSSNSPDERIRKKK